jgi:hypothetical protein
VVVHTSQTGGINRRIKVQAIPGINTRAYLKNKAKRAQVVERQPSKCKAMSSDPSTAKNKTVAYLIKEA